MDSGTLIDYGLMGAVKWMAESSVLFLLIALVIVTVIILHYLERLLCRYQAKRNQRPKHGLVGATPINP